MKKSFWILVIVIILVLIGYWLFMPSYQSQEVETLRKENEALRSQLALQASSPLISEESGFEGLKAKIFSSYPFNDKSLIVVSAGSNHGVLKGMPVTAEGNILVGQVQEVHKHFSVVRTIFDPSWSSPIRIGDSKADGLLIGGVEPEIQLVEKDLNIVSGDIVRSASDEFPYGLLLGSVDVLEDDPAQTFREATLAPDVRFNALQSVFIITDFSI